MRKDLAGRRYGRWLVLHHEHQQYFRCRCDCGSERMVQRSNLETGNTSQCRACYLRAPHRGGANRKHGAWGSRLWIIWRNMRARCYSVGSQSYKAYGARGITICDAWRSEFAAFRDWAETTGYNENLTIERIDNDKDYSPENCRWATPKEQARNRRNTRYVEFCGRRITVSEASERTGLCKATLWKRWKKWGTLDNRRADLISLVEAKGGG